MKLMKYMAWFIIKILKYATLTILAFAFLLIFNYLIIGTAGNTMIHDNSDKISHNAMILVLGAGSTEPGIWINPSFDNRMLKTVEVYNSGHITKVILSGMYLPPYYNEPDAMFRVLGEGGIPEKNMETDYNGTRTWESVLSAKRKYPDDDFIIIAQKSQLQRALFISWFTGFSATGIAAAEPSHVHWYWIVREILARAKCSADCLVYLIKKI